MASAQVRKGEATAIATHMGGGVLSRDPDSAARSLERSEQPLGRSIRIREATTAGQP